MAMAARNASARIAARTLRRHQSAFAVHRATVAPTPTHTDAPPPPHTPPPKPQSQLRPDPYTLLTPELTHVRTSLLSLLDSSHTSLSSIAQYYFLHPSKQLRPLLVLLFARATNGLGRDWEARKGTAWGEGVDNELLDRPLTRPDVLNDWNPTMPDHTASFSAPFELHRPHPPSHSPKTPQNPHPIPPLHPHSPILPTQLRLAQIVEMIHVASLLHDDVIDKSPLRRGAPSAPAAFGNKLAVLGGDFLLGRASVALARLGDLEAVELISTVIANLVEGEILQMRGNGNGGGDGDKDGDPWARYLNKTYLKTASLMAKGARTAVVLGGAGPNDPAKDIAYAYGRNLGIAFQLVDDVLDFDAGEGGGGGKDVLGKPRNADLALGLATGPALYAAEEHPELRPLIERKFAGEGDVQLARDLVRRSAGIERTRTLARAHAQKARDVLGGLPESDARAALEVLTERVVERGW